MCIVLLRSTKEICHNSKYGVVSRCINLKPWLIFGSSASIAQLQPPKTTMSIIYIIYNANASLLGKASYALRKLRAPSDQPTCAACDLTHRGWNLNETKEWTATKARIGAAEVRQLHRDELDVEVGEFVKTEGLRYPLVLGKAGEGAPLVQLMNTGDLAGTSSDHERFLAVLREKAREKGVPLLAEEKKNETAGNKAKV
jgi:hypothetical protein